MPISSKSLTGYDEGKSDNVFLYVFSHCYVLKESFNWVIQLWTLERKIYIKCSKVCSLLSCKKYHSSVIEEDTFYTPIETLCFLRTSICLPRSVLRLIYETDRRELIFMLWWKSLFCIIFYLSAWLLNGSICIQNLRHMQG